MSAEGWGQADIRASALEILEEMRRGANERFDRYKQELGLSERTP